MEVEHGVGAILLAPLGQTLSGFPKIMWESVIRQITSQAPSAPMRVSICQDLGSEDLKIHTGPTTGIAAQLAIWLLREGEASSDALGKRDSACGEQVRVASNLPGSG